MDRNIFKMKPNPIELVKKSNPKTYFDRAGRKACILGYENGNFEFWCYPFKICRVFSLSFLLENSSTPIEPSSIVKNISHAPERTIITFCHQSFTIKEIFITPLNESGAIILLDIETVEPIKIIVSFIPELQPMWPAGIGGQTSFWSDEDSGFIITEPTKKYNAFIGSPEAKKMSTPPAHMLSESPVQFMIEVTPQKSKSNIYSICLSGGVMDRDTGKNIYNNLLNDPMKYYDECFEYYKLLSLSTLNIITPDEKINLAFEWGKVAFDNMIVSNPYLGKGLVAGLGCSGKSGRPGFGWFFGGDASLNSFAMLGYGEFDTIKNSLKFIQKYQRDDGKIAHEISQSAELIDWFGKYPYAYLHADTSCFYIISMYEYMCASGDVEFIKESWTSLLKAYDWCVLTDENQDGLMDNPKAGLGAFEIPPFTKVISDIYLSASFAMALFCMNEMAKALPKPEEEFLAKFEETTKKMEEIFWDKENEFFTFAVNMDKEIIKEKTALCAVPMIWKLFDEKKALKSLEKINSSELQTDWGTRSMSSKSSYYDPLNYNYGAVWPFLTGFPCLANYRYRNSKQGFTLLKSSVEHVFDNTPGVCHEVFSGNTNIHLEESVPHQAFSTMGYMLPLIKGTLGLSTNAVINEMNFFPQIPASWEYLEIQNYRTGNTYFDFFIEKGVKIDDEEDARNEILGIHFNIRGSETYKLNIQLVFPLFTKIHKVTIGNQEIEHKITKSEKDSILSITVKDYMQGTIVIVHDQFFEIIPYENISEIGTINQGLKFLTETDTEKEKRIIVEGLAGYKYFLEISHSDLISKVLDAELVEGGIFIEFPESDTLDFIRKEIVIYKD